MSHIGVPSALKNIAKEVIMPANLDLKAISDQMNELGYVVIKNFFTSDQITNLESCYIELFLMQACKIKKYQNNALKISKSNRSNFEKMDAIYLMMHDDDKEALYQTQNFFSSSPLMQNTFNCNFFDLCTTLLNCKGSQVLSEGPFLFINQPNTQRLLYGWHSEANYYPKRKKFLNIWFPVFCNKLKSNGTMSFKEGTHKCDFPFNEHKDGVDHLTQLDISNSILEDYKEFFCEVSMTDIVIFDRNLVHRSNHNSSKNFSYASVLRVWTPLDDLTTRGDFSVGFGEK